MGTIAKLMSFRQLPVLFVKPRQSPSVYPRGGLEKYVKNGTSFPPTRNEPAQRGYGSKP